MDDHTLEAKHLEAEARFPVCCLPLSVRSYRHFYCPDQDRRLGKSCRKFQSLRPSAYVLPLGHPSRSLYDHTVVYAAISSVSLSLIATAIDASFDFGSNLFLYLINRQAGKMDINKWPVGGARLETIGNIIYGEILADLCKVAHPHSRSKVLCTPV